MTCSVQQEVPGGLAPSQDIDQDIGVDDDLAHPPWSRFERLDRRSVRT
jgi:hypothetical protein